MTRPRRSSARSCISSTSCCASWTAGPAQVAHPGRRRQRADRAARRAGRGQARGPGIDPGADAPDRGAVEAARQGRPRCCTPSARPKPASSTAASPQIADRAARFHADEIVFTSLGEGATSEGEFWEALNVACAKQLPVLFLIEDNGYAISVPVEVQTAGGDISRLVRGFPGPHVDSIDGTDFFASLRAMREAAAHVRARKGPAFVHAHVHSAVLALAVRRRKALQDAGGARSRSAPRSDRAVLGVPAAQWTRHRRAEFAAIAADVEREINDARNQALQAAEAGQGHRRALGLFARRRPDVRRVRHAGRSPKASRTRWSAAINRTLKDEMARDPAHRRLRRGRGGRQPQGRARSS